MKTSSIVISALVAMTTASTISNAECNVSLVNSCLVANAECIGSGIDCTTCTEKFDICASACESHRLWGHLVRPVAVDACLFSRPGNARQDSQYCSYSYALECNEDLASCQSNYKSNESTCKCTVGYAECLSKADCLGQSSISYFQDVCYTYCPVSESDECRNLGDERLDTSLDTTTTQKYTYSGVVNTTTTYKTACDWASEQECIGTLENCTSSEGSSACDCFTPFVSCMNDASCEDAQALYYLRQSCADICSTVDCTYGLSSDEASDFVKDLTTTPTYTSLTYVPSSPYSFYCNLTAGVSCSNEFSECLDDYSSSYNSGCQCFEPYKSCLLKNYCLGPQQSYSLNALCHAECGTSSQYCSTESESNIDEANSSCFSQYGDCRRKGVEGCSECVLELRGCVNRASQDDVNHRAVFANIIDPKRMCASAA